jgi:hypothetical protein
VSTNDEDREYHEIEGASEQADAADLSQRILLADPDEAVMEQSQCGCSAADTA